MSHGPYETEGQAYLDAVHVYDARFQEPGLAYIAKINGGLLFSACRDAGVALGAYDRQVLGDLADGDPEDVQVVIGLIERAHASGRDQLAAEMAELHARIDAAETAARRAAPVQADLDSFRRQISNRGAR